MKNDMTQWIKYFLVGIEQTATKAAETLSSILKFKSEAEDLIRSSYRSRSTNAIILLHKLMKLVLQPTRNMHRKGVW